MTSQQLKECGAFCSIQFLWVIYMPDNQSRAPWQTPIATGVTSGISISVIFHKDRLSNNTTFKHL